MPFPSIANNQRYHLSIDLISFYDVFLITVIYITLMECLAVVILIVNVIIIKVHYMDTTVQVPAMLVKCKKRPNRIAKISVKPIGAADVRTESSETTTDLVSNENQWHLIAKQIDTYGFTFGIVFVCFVTLLLFCLLM